MKKITLSKESVIEVYDPSLDFFLAKIEAGEYFSFAKQLHGFWDGILGAMIVEPSLRKIEFTEAYLKKLSATMVEVKNAITTLRYTPSLYFDVLQLVTKLDQLPNNFYFGISDLDFYPHNTPPHSINSYIPSFNDFKLLDTNNTLKCREMRCGDRQLIIQHFLPKNYTPFNGIVWRRYGYNGLLESFFEKVKSNHTIIIVGPEYYKDFGSLVDLPSFHHLPINGSSASENKQLILNEILQHHKTLPNTPKIYFFIAGTLSVWLISKLHHQLSKSYLLDVGQALDAVIPPEKMQKTTPFQLLGFKKAKGFKTYKTAKPNYFIEKKQGDSIEINDQKEVIFLDEKRTKFLCRLSSLQMKVFYWFYHKAKFFRYKDHLFLKKTLQLLHYFNYWSKSK